MVVRREEISIEIEEITVIRSCAVHGGAYCPHCGAKLEAAVASPAPRSLLPEPDGLIESVVVPVLKSRKSFFAGTAAAHNEPVIAEMKDGKDAGRDGNKNEL